MLRFAENFSVYGTASTGRTNMLDGVWLAVNTAAGDDTWPLTTNPRGLGTHHLRMQFTSGAAYITRFSLGGNLTELIVGAAFYLANLPSANDKTTLFNLRDTANVDQVTIAITTTGKIQVQGGALGSTVLADSDALSPTPPIIAGSYQFVEVYALASDTVGEIEVRVDGITVINATGINTQNTANTGYEQIGIGKLEAGGLAGGEMDICDVYTIDMTGGNNDDFLGDVQWLSIYPNGDTATSDYTAGSDSSPPLTFAADYEAIDETTPDDDASYVESGASAGSTSIYALGNLPATVSEVVGVCMRPRMRKVDAGSSQVQVSLRSTAAGSPVADADGTDRALTETYVYYSDYVDVDPQTGVRFTPTSFNAAQLKIERTL